MTDNDDMNFSSAMAAFEAKHFSRAMQLMSPIAEQGNPEAQHRVAIMFQNGLGMARNPEAAVKWMRAAAEQGHALAQHGLGFMYLEGECLPKDGEQAAYWFKRAAEQGLAGSLTTLAMMYEQDLPQLELEPEALEAADEEVVPDEQDEELDRGS